MFHEPIDLTGCIIVSVLKYTENTGAALSLGDSLPKAVSFWLLSVVPLLFPGGPVFVCRLFVKLIWWELTNWKLFAFSLIFAGGLGNIIDRIAFDRHVTDFMNVGIGSLRTGIFNVADMCVTGGVIVLLFAYWERKPAPASPAATGASE